MHGRIALVAIAALSFGLGVVVQAETIRQRSPATPRAVSPTRVQATEPTLTKGAHQNTGLTVDLNALRFKLQTLEQRVLELEAQAEAHTHRYSGLGASRTITVSRIKDGDERYDDYSVWVLAPDLGDGIAKTTTGPPSQ